MGRQQPPGHPGQQVGPPVVVGVPGLCHSAEERVGQPLRALVDYRSVFLTDERSASGLSSRPKFLPSVDFMISPQFEFE